MNWHYYIPHMWEASTTIWEDIYLYPASLSWDSPALFITVDAVDESTYENHGLDAEEYRELLRRLPPDKNYLIEGNTLTVISEPFSLDSFLSLVRIWLAECGYACNELSPVSYERMAKYATGHHFPGDQHQ